MILYVSGDLFQSPAQVLVNTVNTVGVMGKGIALEFKKLYPDMFKEYQKRCESGDLDIGKLFLYKTTNKWVLNFPTKRHWRDASKVEYIERGLETFAQVYSEWGIHSIAFPPLGCGNGRLDFASQVQPIMHKYLSRLPIDVFIYPSLDEDLIAEQEQPDKIHTWLRGEPQSLPFSEVWADISELLKARSEFTTPSGSSSFTVSISDAGDALVINPENQSRYTIAYGALLAMWQQLRDHGFSRRDTVPGIDRRRFSHLFPVFERLSYVTSIGISDSYERFGRPGSRTLGLQVLPRMRKKEHEVHQLDLFVEV